MNANENFWKWHKRMVTLQNFPDDEKIKEEFYQAFRKVIFFRKNKTKILGYVYKKSYIAGIRAEFLHKWYIFEDANGKEVSLRRPVQQFLCFTISEYSMQK